MVVRMSNRGSVTLPPSVRNGLPDNTLFQVVRRSDGVIELRPQITVDASQAWFWTERWQQMEREADADFAEDRSKSYENPDAFLADLEDEAKPE